MNIPKNNFRNTNQTAVRTSKNKLHQRYSTVRDKFRYNQLRTKMHYNVMFERETPKSGNTHDGLFVHKKGL